MVHTSYLAKYLAFERERIRDLGSPGGQVKTILKSSEKTTEMAMELVRQPAKMQNDPNTKEKRPPSMINKLNII